MVGENNTFEAKCELKIISIKKAASVPVLNEYFKCMLCQKRGGGMCNPCTCTYIHVCIA